MLESIAAVLIDVLLILLVYGGWTILRQKRKMTELANTDPLTGLYNVRRFMSIMKQLHENKQPFGVLYLDLNKFKEVNDQYGHDAGDKIFYFGSEGMNFRLSYRNRNPVNFIMP